MCATLCVANDTLHGVRNVAPHVTASDVPRCVRGSQLAPMTTTPDLLNRLRREWRQSGATLEARRAARAFAARHRDLGLEYVDDLVEVVALLETRGTRSVIERARLVQALLEDARDPLIHRALLQTLLPGIVSVCRQLRFGDGIIDDPSETLTVAITLCAELLHDWAGQSRPYAAPDVLSGLRGRLRRYLLKEKQHRRALTSAGAVEAVLAASSSTSLESRLEQLRGTPHDRLARLTYARVFEGVSLKELAAHDHSAPVTLQQELQRFAVRHLI